MAQTEKKSFFGKSTLSKLILLGLLVGGNAHGALLTELVAKDIRDTKTPLKNLSSEGKKATVAIFLSSQCPCSKGQAKYIRDLSEKFNTDFKFVAISSNKEESSQSALEYFKKLDFSFPILRDESQVIGKELGALKTPHAFVLSPQGDILFSGGLLDTRDPSKAQHHFLSNALKNIHEGKPVEQKFAKTLGCYINYL